MKKQWMPSAAAAALLMLVVACADEQDRSAGQAGGGTSGEAGAPASAGDDAGGQAGASSTPAASCDPPPVVGPANGQAGAGGEALAIVGTFTDNWGSDHTISDSRWVVGTSAYDIARFDNAARWVVAQNDDENEYNPCRWSRFEWAEIEGTLFYCQSAYAAPNEAAALATPAADASNPKTTGCGASPWSELVAR